MLAGMYASHFGLRERPFSPTPDARFIYLSEGHREALAHLHFGVAEPGGFVVLTGEVGTGKTMTCRYLLEHLPEDTDVALILNPMLTAPELLAAVCDELKIPYPAGTTSLKALVDTLHGRLLDAHARGRQTVVIVDEAQHLSLDVLEQIRLLTNLETARDKLLRVVLVGQPELIHLLARRELRQLAQRVTARYHLPPFAPAETRAYVLHRLWVAGQSGEVFAGSALREVHRWSGGVPRLINLVCDRALLGAYAHESERVSGALVRRAAAEVLGSGGRARRPRSTARVAIASGGLAAAIVLGLAAWASLAHVANPFGDLVRGLTARSSVPARVATESVSAVSAVTLASSSTPSLAAILMDPSTPADEAAAFATLFARWNVQYAGALRPCDAAAPAGLACLSKRGTWTVLRRLDLPVVLPLVTPEGDRRHAALVGLEGPTATLAFGDRQVTIPAAEVEELWDGAFTLLLSRPPFALTVLTPGMRGSRVAWLTQRLDGLEGRVAPTTSPVYDDTLQDRVAEFQRRHALVPDGIAGEETLIRLTALADGRAPSLSTAVGGP